MEKGKNTNTKAQLDIVNAIYRSILKYGKKFLQKIMKINNFFASFNMIFKTIFFKIRNYQ
jgi:hypothetical protein